jgi:hypothetical protein
MYSKEELQDKIKELETQKRKISQQVNIALGEISGRIAVYKELLEMDEDQDE